MDLEQYRQYLESLSFGKRLPGAVHVHREGAGLLGEGWDRLAVQVGVGLSRSTFIDYAFLNGLQTIMLPALVTTTGLFLLQEFTPEHKPISQKLVRVFLPMDKRIRGSVRDVRG